MSHQRKNVRRSCVVPVDGKGGSVFDETLAVDFSKGGIGFISKHRIPLHKKIPIELELSIEGTPIIVVGRVQWVRRLAGSGDYRVGVTFTDVVKGSKSRINQYFKEYKTE